MSLIPAPNGYPIKLVRDETPNILNASGEPGDLWYGECPPELIPTFLLKKLAEEVGEFLVDGGESELADILVVIWSIERFYGWDAEGVAAQDKRGRFDEYVMMFGRHKEFDGEEKA